MIRRVACTLVIASSSILIGTVPAQASKEKFVRTKPHVNAGTFGEVRPGEVLTIQISLLNVARLTGEIREAQTCSAELDVRYFSAGHPDAAPLDERLAVRLGPNDPLEFAFTPGPNGAPLTVLYAIVARDVINVDGVTCVLRGIVSVRDVADGRTTRVLPLRPEDFFVYEAPR